MRKIQLKADGTCAIEYEGEGEPQKTRWALGYNQFKILSDNGAYVPYTWRIDNEGNLNLIDPEPNYNGTYQIGEIKMIFKKKK